MTNSTIIIGSGSGIGKAVAEELIFLERAVILADQDLSAWENSATKPQFAHKLNVLDAESIDQFISFLEDKQLSIEGLVFTVGKAITLALKSSKPEMVSELLQLNSTSFFLIVSKIMEANLFSNQGASIVVISSIVGQTGAKGKSIYAATKGALDAAIRSMALELAPMKIKINAIAPGTLNTPMLAKLVSVIGAEEVDKLAMEFPLGLGEPKDVADLVIFLLGDGARWISGQVVTIDGGFTAR